MRFDIEIPSINVDIVYIPEGRHIPAGIIPLDYVHMDHKDKIPSDFLSISENAILEDFAGQGADEHDGPSFIIKGNRFRVTHIAKYSPVHNVKVPLFWKHVIENRPFENINIDTIRIIDYYGDPIDPEKFMIDQLLDIKTGQKITTVYTNKNNNEFYFIEYVSGDRIYKKLLNLQPIFTEVGWEDMVWKDEDIPDWKYVLNGNTIKTTYTGKLWIEYDHEKNPIRRPVANIDDNWYVGILNAEWSVYNQQLGATMNYSIPEYYLQHSTEKSRFSMVSHKKCKILFESIIKTQSNIDITRRSLVDVFVYDNFTKELKFALTTDQSKNGSLYNNTVFQLIEDINADGIIVLPIKLTDRDIVFATYPNIDNFYEFRFFDFNSDIMNSGGHVAIYVKPNVNESEMSVFYALIGDRTTRNGQYIGSQGLIFETTNEYYDFIEESHSYHIAMIKVSSREEANILKINNVRSIGGQVKDRKLACEITQDMILHDLVNKNIAIPTNDTLIAELNGSALKRKRIISYDSNTAEFDNDTYKRLIKMHSLISKSMDVSTRVILSLGMPLKKKNIFMSNNSDYSYNYTLTLEGDPNNGESFSVSVNSETETVIA